MANKERFNIKHFVKNAGIFLQDAEVLGVSRLKLVIERAGVTNEVTVYGRIAGQSTWDLVGVVTGNNWKEFDVSLFDNIRLESTVYDSPTNYLEVTGSGFYLSPAAGSSAVITSPLVEYSTAPTITLLAMPVNSTEYNISLPVDTKKFIIKDQEYSSVVNLSFISNDTNYIKIPRGCSYEESDLKLTTSSRTLYLKSNKDNVTIMCLSWK